MRNQQKGDHATNEFQLAIACAALVLVTDERIWISAFSFPFHQATPLAQNCARVVDTEPAVASLMIFLKL